MNIHSDTTEITRQCKECFNYIHSGLSSPCCNKITCNYEVVSTISASNPKMSYGASFQTLLNQTFATYNKCNQDVNTSNIAVWNSVNNENISLELQAQLLNYSVVRNNKFQPVRNEIIPPSVLQLQRETVNVGVPKPINVCRPKPMSLSYNFMG